MTMLPNGQRVMIPTDGSGQAQPVPQSAPKVRMQTAHRSVAVIGMPVAVGPAANRPVATAPVAEPAAAMPSASSQPSAGLQPAAAPQTSVGSPVAPDSAVSDTAALAAPAAAPSLDATPSLNPLSALAKTSFVAFIEKPLFDPTRRLPPVIEPVQQVARVVVAPPPPPEEPPNLHLLGIIQGERNIAVVHRGDETKTEMFSNGDHIDGWEVIVPPTLGMQLKKGDRVVDLKLFTPGAPGAPGTNVAQMDPEMAQAQAQQAQMQARARHERGRPPPPRQEY